MSWFTAAAGLDPAINSFRKRDWFTFLGQITSLFHKYVGTDTVNQFLAWLASVGIDPAKLVLAEDVAKAVNQTLIKRPPTGLS